ncbi:hypothetical protein FCM35_KLT08067 [Carex littledalei]|uniref:Uncharacterized protein n=1 Tax=Carex littledalei TaxID=544730 RepID=A0A833QRD1_9POAL|nr:hypothetical protein FCM35_KLT08067 [Carex littledalei]
MTFPSMFKLRVANSTPMVDFDSRLNSFFVNRESRLDLPTPESPICTQTALLPSLLWFDQQGDCCTASAFL